MRSLVTLKYEHRDLHHRYKESSIAPTEISIEKYMEEHGKIYEPCNAGLGLRDLEYPQPFLHRSGLRDPGLRNTRLGLRDLELWVLSYLERLWYAGLGLRDLEIWALSDPGCGQLR